MTRLTAAVLPSLLLLLCITANARQPVPEKPRILVSTDIGGTDLDDNQSMTHLLMYSDMFDIEGLVSSPSFGDGSADEIKRMIAIYEKDYPAMKRHAPGLMSPARLRKLCKQGRRGLMPFKGYDKPTEGSDWIVRQARKKSGRPLWILVWGTLEDVAQALHDAPDIKDKIRIYYIGGPNKKWGADSYAYIASNHPDLWMIENNATYRGLITDSKKTDKYNTGYYDYAIRGAGNMGSDFINYYEGVVKMGDTPSLLYVMDGNPEKPGEESWGGSFVRTGHSPRRIFSRQLTVKDTVPVYSIIELRFEGPHTDIPMDSACFTITIDKQEWDGNHTGNGTYSVRYVPKSPARLTYLTSSAIEELNGLKGEFVVIGAWPGPCTADDYILGDRWFTDKPDKNLYEGKWQGAASIRKHRAEILEEWAERWKWVR